MPEPVRFSQLPPLPMLPDFLSPEPAKPQDKQHQQDLPDVTPPNEIPISNHFLVPSPSQVSDSPTRDKKYTSFE